MKSKIMFMFLLFAMSIHAQNNNLSSWDGTSTIWTKGDGTQTDPFLIESAANLAHLAVSVNSGTGYKNIYFKQIVDIDLNGKESDNPRQKWIPIGDKMGTPFKGNYNGNGFIITDLYCHQTTDYAGLFGMTDGGTINNVGIKGESSVIGTMAVAGVVARAMGVYVENCYNEAKVTGTTFVGGIAGMSSGSKWIKYCYNKGNISGKEYIGGILGNGNSTRVIECYNLSNITGTGESIGGIIGSSRGDFSTISSCYNMGEVHGSNQVGGIVGVFMPQGVAFFSRCYNTGNIISIGKQVTSLAGIILSGTIEKNFYLEGSGPNSPYGISKTTEELKNQDIVNILNENYSADIYLTDREPNINNGYPVFIWQVKCHITTEVANNIGGKVIGGGIYTYGKKIELKPIAEEDYKFLQWQDGNIDNPRKITVKSNETYIAEFVSASGEFFSEWDGSISEWLRGTGNEYDPYLIESASHLAQLSKNVSNGNNYADKYFRLMVNVDLNGKPTDEPRRKWTPIGKDNSKPFNGNFDGNGHVIRDLFIEQSGQNTGLFGYIKDGGIYNIGIIGNSNVKGGNYTGAIVGNSLAQISNCYSECKVEGIEYVGGIVGKSTKDIINCYNSGNIKGTKKVGGVIGEANRISNCYNTGSIEGNPQETAIGGICGYGLWCINSYFLSGSSPDNGKGIIKNEEELKSDEFITQLNGGLMQWHKSDTYPKLIWQIATVIKWTDLASNEFGGGDGTETNPYQISKAEHLALLAKNVNTGETYPNTYFKLTKSIDLKGTIENKIIMKWNSIGKLKKDGFKGHFDGCGLEIENVYLYEDTHYIGFFGNLNGGNIQNLGITGKSNIGGLVQFVGGIAGYASNLSNISKCYNEASITSYMFAGGIIGKIDTQSILSGCYNSGIINGEKNIGGIIGESSRATVFECYNKGDINSLRGSGGIIGYAGNTPITNSYNTGKIVSGSYVGGIAGEVITSTNPIITFSSNYNTGNVISSENKLIGGFVGSISASAVITNCFFLEGTGSDNGKGEVKTINEMKTNDFVTILNGESNPTIWRADLTPSLNDGYPIINWQTSCVIKVKVYQGIGGTVTGEGRYEHGTDITLTAIPESHYQFTGWDDGNKENPRNIKVLGHITYTAIFELEKHNITVSSNEGGSVEGAGEYSYGSTVTLKAISQEHYNFIKWNDGSVENPREIVVSKDAEYIAEFKAKDYTITVKAHVGGSATGSGTYPYGTEVELKATTNEGYNFIKWSDGTVENPYKIKVTKDAIFAAEFMIQKYDITVTADEGGSTTGSGNYKYGTEAILTATANIGYKFDKWDDGDTDNPRSITVKAAATYTAKFTPKNYTITINTTIGGNVNGGGVYPYGTEIELTAIADKNYEFEKWDDNNTDNPRKIKVTKNATYKANFRDLVGIDNVSTNKINIYAHKSIIYIENTECTNMIIDIYDLSGKIIEKIISNDMKMNINIDKTGIYILICNGKSHKIVIKE